MKKTVEPYPLTSKEMETSLMRIRIVAASAAILALFALDPAIAAEKGAGGIHPEYGSGTRTDNAMPDTAGSNAFGPMPCSEILASPRAHPRGQVQYCRSTDHPY